MSPGVWPRRRPTGWWRIGGAGPLRTPSRWRTAGTAAIVTGSLGIVLSACGGGPPALSLSSSGRLGTVVHGRAGSAGWCSGVEDTEASLRGAAQAQGASFGVLSHVVRRDEDRLSSALEGFHGATSAPAREELEVALTTVGQAFAELQSRRLAGESAAGKAAGEVGTALTRLLGAKGSTC